MRLHNLMAIWLLLGCLLPLSSLAELSVVDDLGATIRLDRPAARVVSLAPHLTELVFAIGAGERLIAVDMRSDYPPAAKSIPRIGRAGRFDLEKLLALNPDLVLAWHSGNPAQQIEKLRRLGLTVYHSEPRQAAAIIDNLRKLGVLLDAQAAANALADRLQARLQAIGAHYQGRAAVRYFYQVWNQPMITLNGEHLVSHGLALCGGVNVFADALGLAPRVSLESVLAARPEVIIASGEGSERPPWLDDWRDWPDLPAVRDNRLQVLHPDLAFRPTPRFFKGLEQMCGWLDAARQADHSGTK